MMEGTRWAGGAWNAAWRYLQEEDGAMPPEGESRGALPPWLTVAYLVPILLYILSVFGLGSQETARKGNAAGIIGAAVSWTTTYVWFNLERGDGTGWWVIAVASAVGGVCGLALATLVKMTSMPAMVALLNASGGLTAALASLSVYLSDEAEAFVTEGESRLQLAFLILSLDVGMVTMSGSVVAMAKLEGLGWASAPPRVLAARGVQIGINIMALLALVALSVCTGLASYAGPPDEFLLVPNSLGVNGVAFALPLAAVAAGYGVWLVLPIGGADMPVVVSVLNSLSGMSTCTAGFMQQNTLLIVAGALVASSGAVLAYLMCEAMNRRLLHVLMGGFGQGSAQRTTADRARQVPVEETTTTTVAHELCQAKRVCIVPGFGMAVAGAQHDAARLVKLLQRDHGVDVRFAIHPVAGRLPGHMNVLLAEARVSYEIVDGLEAANAYLPTCDVVLVVGANDVANPLAETDPTCSISGMPVVHVWTSKRVVVLKRSMATGYAALDNPLFDVTEYPKTRMLFGDAKNSLSEIVSKVANTPPRSRGMRPRGGQREISTLPEAHVEHVADPLVVGVPREGATDPRVALTPTGVGRLCRSGKFRVLVESGAGERAQKHAFSDDAFIREGAEICEEVFSKADILVAHTIPPPTRHTRAKLVVGAIGRADIADYEHAGVQCMIALDLVPRITAAQKLDSLSSMSLLAGCRSVVESEVEWGSSGGAGILHSITTAAGEWPPCRVLVLGAGVAGLAAVSEAKARGADVIVFDVRPECRDQVESLGATFLALGARMGDHDDEESFLAAERAVIEPEVERANIVIATAAIPGRDPPILVTAEAVAMMQPGSVICDLSGGNCAMTRQGERFVTVNGVIILGYTNLAVRLPAMASEMYSTNVVHLLEHITRGCQVSDSGRPEMQLSLDDPVLRPMLIVMEGRAIERPPPPPRGPPPPRARKSLSSSEPAEQERESSPAGFRLAHLIKPERPVRILGMRFASGTLVCLAAFFVIIGIVAAYFPDSFAVQLTTFELACVVGYTAVWGVTPALHTPLMSLSNALSGTVLLSAMVQCTGELTSASLVLGGCGTAVGAVNLAGGFAVTQRILGMFATSVDDDDADPT